MSSGRLGPIMVILRKRVAGLTARSLESFVRRAQRVVHLRGVVNVLVSTDTELRRLNCRFRKKDKPTDVLSFPPAVDGAEDFAGDVAISATIAAQNARRLGHSAADEIRILALHGVLHLAGYDHERDGGEMAGKEARLRSKLGLPVALIERNELDLPVGRKHLAAKPAKNEQLRRGASSVGPKVTGLRRPAATPRRSR
jgi:probable rRNA maturation factor